MPTTEGVGRKIDTAIRHHLETPSFTGDKYPAFMKLDAKNEGFLLAVRGEAALYVQVKLTWK